MGAGFNAMSAGNAHIRIDVDEVIATVVAVFYGTCSNACVTVDALIFVNLNYFGQAFSHVGAPICLLDRHSRIHIFMSREKNEQWCLVMFFVHYQTSGINHTRKVWICLEHSRIMPFFEMFASPKIIQSNIHVPSGCSVEKESRGARSQTYVTLLSEVPDTKVSHDTFLECFMEYGYGFQD